ncbi:MAG TPA: DUF72 domain-containing protein [Phycisphaerae bacterium]|nr:DUF72 domain-containing protein [Phycisphaerae bacterium]
MSATGYIGTSGFTYDHWREVFYPVAVPKRAWLEHYCEHFDTVEINASYYHMPRPNVCESWRRRSPEGFRFVMKLNGLITHRRRLADCGEPLASFLEAVDRLEEKLGPILVQLPPRFSADPQRLAAFLEICPERHRWAVEFRDPSWLCEEVYAVLRAHNAALVVHDLIQDHPRVLTAGWTYLRFHGPGGHDGCYTEQMLRGVAGRIRKHLRAGRDTYVYFNNDLGGHAVNNARRLKQLVSPRRGPSSQTE